MPGIVTLPPVEPDIQGFLLLSIGSLVRFDESKWVTIGFPSRTPGQAPPPHGTCIFRRMVTNEVQTLLYAHCSALWSSNNFQILSDGADKLPQCKQRNTIVPFDRYAADQQAAMNRLEYYCKRFKDELVSGRLTIGATKRIELWLATVPLAAEGSKPLKRGALIRRYKVWLASGENICSLAHGNCFGTHESELSNIQDIIYDVIENILIPNPELELNDAQQLIHTEMKCRVANGELEPLANGSPPPPPSLSTISSYRKKLNRYLAALARDGNDKANRDHQPRGKMVIPWRPHLRWEVDHTLLPILIGVEVTDEFGKTEWVIIGQAWLTVVIDVTTRFLVALFVSTEPPTVVRVITALKIAMCPKGYLFSRIKKLKNRFDVAHIPESVGVDNGKDLPGNANDVKAIMRDFNIEPTLAGVYRGDHKAIVEGFNGRIKRFFRKFPGAIPLKRTKFEPKDRRKSQVAAMTIEKANEFAWRFGMDVYNIAKQAGLDNESPQDLMIRGIKRVEAERANGRPTRIRSILTKTPDEIERTFSVRVTRSVKIYGVRYKGLRWNSGRLAECLNRQVDVRINAENVGRVWVYDDVKSWFIVNNVHPQYAEGLALFIHRRIRKRLIDKEKASGKTSFSIEKYLENRMELLREFFELAGKAGRLKPLANGQRKLQSSTRSLGHSVDFAIAEAKQHAFDIKANRVPPGWGPIIDLKKTHDGTHYAASRDASLKDGAIRYPAFDDENDDDDEDMMIDPLRNGAPSEDEK